MFCALQSDYMGVWTPETVFRLVFTMKRMDMLKRGHVIAFIGKNSAALHLYLYPQSRLYTIWIALNFVCCQF